MDNNRQNESVGQLIFDKGYSGFLSSEGALYMCGGNEDGQIGDGQLGDGTKEYQDKPVKMFRM